VRGLRFRSSATLEDSKNSSFAGVFETVLNVTREDLIESVKKVYASLGNAAGYNKSGLMAVIIQEMIDSDFAGVVFTKNPLTREDEFVVEVVSGLGEALVSGVVNSTQYIVKNNSIRLVRNPLQESKLVVKSRGLEVKKIKNKVKLSKNIILELVRKSMIIEKNFKTPQDIEWCEKKGVLYFLQSRPLIFQQKNFEKNTIKKFEFKGIGVSAGVVTGKAVIIRNEKDFKKILKGSIAVVTLPSDFRWINILKKASGIIAEYGSVLSHPAVLAREFNIPCIVGVKNLSKKVKEGEVITIDGGSGGLTKGFEPPAQKQQFIENIDENLLCFENIKEKNIKGVKVYIEKINNVNYYHFPQGKTDKKILRLVKGKKHKMSKVKSAMYDTWKSNMKCPLYSKIFKRMVSITKKPNTLKFKLFNNQLRDRAKTDVLVAKKLNPKKVDELIAKFIILKDAFDCWVMSAHLLCEGYGVKSAYNSIKKILKREKTPFNVFISLNREKTSEISKNKTELKKLLNAKKCLAYLSTIRNTEYKFYKRVKVGDISYHIEMLKLRDRIKRKFKIKTSRLNSFREVFDVACHHAKKHYLIEKFLKSS